MRDSQCRCFIELHLVQAARGFGADVAVGNVAYHPFAFAIQRVAITAAARRLHDHAFAAPHDGLSALCRNGGRGAVGFLDAAEERRACKTAEVAFRRGAAAFAGDGKGGFVVINAIHPARCQSAPILPGASRIRHQGPFFEQQRRATFDHLHRLTARIADIHANAAYAIFVRTCAHAAGVNVVHRYECLSGLLDACGVRIAAAENARTRCAVALSYDALRNRRRKRLQ